MVSLKITAFALFASSAVTTAQEYKSECTCTVWGDPHIHPFAGKRFDYGNGWSHAAKSADCSFDVQTYASGNKKRLEKASVRFGDDYIMWDFSSRENPLPGNINISSGKTTAKEHKSGGKNGLLYTNDEIGCSVFLISNGNQMCRPRSL